MKQNNINIIHAKNVIYIETEEHYMSFDSKAGERKEGVVCVCLFTYNDKFIDDLEASKIVTADRKKVSYYDKGKSFSILLTPLAFYTNQKLEDIICQLFQKYNL